MFYSVSGISSPADIGTRTVSIEELKRGEWIIEPVWLRRTKRKLPEHVNMIFDSEDKNLTSSVLIKQGEEGKLLFIGNDSVNLTGY